MTQRMIIKGLGPCLAIASVIGAFSACSGSETPAGSAPASGGTNAGGVGGVDQGGAAGTEAGGTSGGEAAAASGGTPGGSAACATGVRNNVDCDPTVDVGVCERTTAAGAVQTCECDAADSQWTCTGIAGTGGTGAGGNATATGGTTGTVACGPGVATDDQCDPAVDTATCDRSTSGNNPRTCECSATTSLWVCTAVAGTGGTGSGGSATATGGTTGTVGCGPGVATDDQCDPAVDTAPCDRSSSTTNPRTCECSATTSLWVCTAA